MNISNTRKLFKDFSYLYRDTNITKAAAGSVVNTIITSITQAIKKGNKVTLVGFGTFSAAKRKARKGRNPRTDAVLPIKAHKAPKFTAGRAFKDAVR